MMEPFMEDSVVKRLKEGIWAIQACITMAKAVMQKGNEWIKEFLITFVRKLAGTTVKEQGDWMKEFTPR